MPVRPRPLALAAGAVVTAALLVSPTSPATAAAATCEGRAPTVTAGAGNRYQGTDGPDVVVATGRNPSVNTGAGDDVVCVASADFATVFGGDGADTVVVTDRRADYDRFRVELGEGDDVFRGGPGQDIVDSLEYEPILYEQGFDTLDTGAGNDQVRVGSDGRRTHRVDLDLGPGDDRLSSYAGGVTSDSVLDGGTGSDRLGFGAYDAAPADVTFDAAARTIDRAGRVVSSWKSFEAYSAGVAGATARFVGSAAGEWFSVFAQSYDVDMAGGRDTLSILRPAGGQASGGAGRDRFVNGSTRRLDLAKGAVGALRVGSFQDATSLRGAVTGDGQANDIVAACRPVQGGGGDDRLRWSGRGTCRFVALGGGGDDLLVGGPRDDRLVGGAGVDRAVGRAGRDLCRAERQRTC